MATGVQPRDDDIQLTKSDLESIQDAMKDKKFRKMFADYCEEIRDPANQALYQKEMTQLEKERGYDVTFINPESGFVIKTSVAGDRKAFINICSNTNVRKPSCSVDQVSGQKGLNWQIPYSLIPPREDFDKNRQRCVLYDVVYHPDTLRMAAQNPQFRDLVIKTAFDALKSNYDIHLDINNKKRIKTPYKGMPMPAVLRKEDPDFKPVEIDEEDKQMSPELIEKLYPQRSYKEGQKDIETSERPHRKRVKNSKKEFVHSTENGYTIPKYIIKQQKDVDLQEFTYNRDCKEFSAIPTQIVVEVYMPMLTSTKDCILDVKEKSLSLKSEKPAKYKLNIPLPYAVNDDKGNAKFDKSRHKLIVTLPVIRKYNVNIESSKGDSGVDSENGSLSDDDIPNRTLVEELPSTPVEVKVETVETNLPPPFLDTSLSYILPSYTHNVLDNIIAFTFHVKNAEPHSVKVNHENNKVQIKFTSIGSGYVPIHYAALIVLNNTNIENLSGEAWDNNVILQIEVAGELPKVCDIGLDEDSLVNEVFDTTFQTQDSKEEDKTDKIESVVEVRNSSCMTNIVVSTSEKDLELDEDDDVPEDPIKINVISDDSKTAAKSILRKPISISHSFSESSVGDIASSVDYMSSDCIPEESSYKKTVRFNNVIATTQLYRYNSSIEGQKKKNQRKKNKKRSQERKKSESEAEDDREDEKYLKQSVPKSTKERRDSGLADTSDTEDAKTSPDSSPTNGDNKKWEQKEGSKKKNKYNCDNIQHNTDLYDPSRLNKGKYLEVKFKNDLIFDLDM